MMNSLFAAALVFSTAAYAIEIPVAMDVHVDAAFPTLNAGSLPTVNLGAKRTAFLVFEGGPYAPASLVRARLRLFVSRNTLPGAIVQVASVSGVLPEEGAVTASNAPAMDAPQSLFGAPSDRTFVEVDATEIVRKQLAGGKIVLALRAQSNDDALLIAFDSKESTATSHPAVLQLIFGGPAGLQGPQGDPGPAGLQGDQGATGPAGTRIVRAETASFPPDDQNNGGWFAIYQQCNVDLSTRPISGDCEFSGSGRLEYSGIQAVVFNGSDPTSYAWSCRYRQTSPGTLKVTVYCAK
jgi:hypothetical protein